MTEEDTFEFSAGSDLDSSECISNFMSLEPVSELGLSMVRFRRRPPRILWTKTQSKPKNLQLEHIGGALGAFVSSDSPSHLIFFSRQERHALRATGRLELDFRDSLASDEPIDAV